MWNTQIIINNIDKWNEQTNKQALLLQLHLWFAIQYMTKLIISKFTIQQQINLLFSFSSTNAHMFFPLNSDDILEMYFRVKPLIPLCLKMNSRNTPNDPNEFMNYLKTNNYFQYMDNGTKYYNMMGGYMFSNDEKNFQSKIDDISNNKPYKHDPLNGFSLLYFIVRNNPTDAMKYISPCILKSTIKYENTPKNFLHEYKTVLKKYKIINNNKITEYTDYINQLNQK